MQAIRFSIEQCNAISSALARAGLGLVVMPAACEKSGAVSDSIGQGKVDPPFSPRGGATPVSDPDADFSKVEGVKLSRRRLPSGAWALSTNEVIEGAYGGSNGFSPGKSVTLDLATWSDVRAVIDGSGWYSTPLREALTRAIADGDLAWMQGAPQAASVEGAPAARPGRYRAEPIFTASNGARLYRGGWRVQPFLIVVAFNNESNQRWFASYDEVERFCEDGPSQDPLRLAVLAAKQAGVLGWMRDAPAAPRTECPHGTPYRYACETCDAEPAAQADGYAMLHSGWYDDRTVEVWRSPDKRVLVVVVENGYVAGSLGAIYGRGERPSPGPWIFKNREFIDRFISAVGNVPGSARRVALALKFVRDNIGFNYLPETDALAEVAEQVRGMQGKLATHAAAQPASHGSPNLSKVPGVVLLRIYGVALGAEGDALMHLPREEEDRLPQFFLTLEAVLNAIQSDAAAAYPPLLREALALAMQNGDLAWLPHYLAKEEEPRGEPRDPMLKVIIPGDEPPELPAGAENVRIEVSGAALRPGQVVEVPSLKPEVVEATLDERQLASRSAHLQAKHEAIESALTDPSHLVGPAAPAPAPAEQEAKPWYTSAIREAVQTDQGRLLRVRSESVDGQWFETTFRYSQLKIGEAYLICNEQRWPTTERPSSAKMRPVTRTPAGDFIDRE